MVTTRALMALFACLGLVAFALPAIGEGLRAQRDYVPFDGEKSTWHEGFERYDF